MKNVAPENTLRSPYNNRGLMAIWSALYNPKERFEPVADQTPSWNRGAYLAEALGHCGDCHTPRTHAAGAGQPATNSPAAWPKAGARTT